MQGGVVTAPARITQAEMQRAVVAARKAAGAGARVVIDLRHQRLEIILGEAAQAAADDNPWEDEDA